MRIPDQPAPQFAGDFFGRVAQAVRFCHIPVYGQVSKDFLPVDLERTGAVAICGLFQA